MKDEIVGTAILTRTKPQELVVVCRKANGQMFLESIPAYAPGDSKPAEHAWLYRIVGDWLHVTPSLHCRYQLPPDQTWLTRFHNTYAWCVKFQWADGVDPAAVWEEAKAANRDLNL